MSGLTRQMSVKAFVAFRSVDRVVGQPSNGPGHARRRYTLHQNRNESLYSCVCLIEMVVNQLGLPQNTAALKRFLSPLYAPSVDICANQCDKIGLLDLTIHPHRPAIRRRCIVLIEHRVDAVLAESVCQSENPVLVDTRIMAVADEYPGCRLLCCASSHSNDWSELGRPGWHAYEPFVCSRRGSGLSAFDLL